MRGPCEWGGIWTRPSLDRRAPSMITLTALVARGHHEELAMHLRAGLHQRAETGRDQGAAAADGDLLRGPRREHRLPDRPADTGGVVRSQVHRLDEAGPELQ